jgi:cellulose synthase (UDP-forming)
VSTTLSTGPPIPDHMRVIPTGISDRLLAPGTSLRRVHALLGILAGLGIAAFLYAWPSVWRAEHPVLLLIVSLIVYYHLGLWVASWMALSNMRRPRWREPEPGLKVGVATTHVPALESIEMLEQTVEQLVAMDYSHDTWVLDEGDDAAVRKLCDRLGAHHFSRHSRPQYHGPSGRFASGSKHGNYNAWFDAVGFDRYDVIATFDPDHVPEKNYLTRTLGYFQDSSVGYVQAPQVYYNQIASFIARGAAEETYDYYSCRLMASYGLGHTVVIGSHSVHRTHALKAVNGFPPHDAEDLLLTMTYRAGGWSGVYVPEVLAMGSAPVDWPGYLRQQVRWSRAVLHLKRYAFVELAGQMSAMDQALSLLHGVHYLRPLLMFGICGVLLYCLVQNVVPDFLKPFPLLALSGLAILLGLIGRFRQQFYLDPDREQGLRWRAMLLQIAKAPYLPGAVINVLLNRPVTYVTTPKVAGPRSHLLAQRHLMLAAVIAGAAGVGVARHGGLHPALVLVTVFLLFLILSLVATEWLDFPAPFDPALWPAARQRGPSKVTPLQSSL